MPEKYEPKYDHEAAFDFDPWSVSSGLPDRITVRIDNPHFGTDAQINNGQTLLFIPEGTIISGNEDGSAGEFQQFYSCGDGWESASKGTRAVRENGQPRKFNANSNYGRMFQSLLSAANNQGLVDELRKRGTPYDAGTWQGLEVYMERVALPEFTGRDGQTVKRDLLLVKRIEKVPGAQGATKASDYYDAGNDGTEEKVSVSSNGDTNAIDPKIKAKLRAIARECASHNEFVEKGLDVEGVLDDPKLEQAVMDDAEGSIWASVKSS